MHSQVLVIYPNNTELKDVMYPYQEIDKYIKDKIDDDRCQFYLTIPEQDIPEVLEEIHNYTKKERDEMLEILQYRSQYRYDETLKKFNRDSLSYVFGLYKSYCDDLKTYEQVKDKPYDDPEQIAFIKDMADFALDKRVDIYIKGQGYGIFHNPVQIWDYYQCASDRGFWKPFLIDSEGNQSNKIRFRDLDIKKTVMNINELSRVWEYIIFCKEDPKSSMIYTTDTIRFNYEWNKCFLVDDLEEVLVGLKDAIKDMEMYDIVALDFHW